MGKYPFTTVKKNTGVVAVPDARLDRLCQIVKVRDGRGEMGNDPVKFRHGARKWEVGKEVRGERLEKLRVVPAAIKFVDIAGLVKGAHKGEGLGNEFLGHIKEVDVICHVVRVFEDANVPHIMSNVDPKRDIEVINTELILKDLETVEKRLGEKKDKKLGTTETQKLTETLKKIRDGLNQGKMVKDLGLSGKEKESIKDLFLLTDKPVVYVFNVSEAQISSLSGNQGIGVSGNRGIRESGKQVNRPTDQPTNRLPGSIPLCAKLEEELFDLEPKEQKEYLRAIGLKELGVDQLIKKCFNLLGLLTFYTIAGGKIVQAWPLRRGKTAFEASEKVHTDMARGFIKAEVISFKDLVEAGSWLEAEKLGKVRLEGKDYVVKNGEVVEFRFRA